jgi:hypothetical protein
VYGVPEYLGGNTGEGCENREGVSMRRSLLFARDSSRLEGFFGEVWEGGEGGIGRRWKERMG